VYFENTMKLHSIAAAIAAASICGFAADTAPKAGALRVFASNGIQEVMKEIQPQAERAIGRPLALEFGLAASLGKRAEAGEAFDAAILTTEGTDALIKSGKIAAATRVEIARVGIGLAVRSGTPKPDIGTPEAMKRTLLKAKSITYGREGASRVYIEKMEERLGITADVKAKTILEEATPRPQERVAAGGAEILMTLISEILPFHELDLAGPLPGDMQHYVSFAAGVAAHTANADAAKALFKFLKTPGLSPVFKAKGMEPR
jgi:molybdate transport system substrate-binding protein